MKGKILAIIFLLILNLSQTLNAQWARTYGTSGYDHAFSIQQTNDGGYIVAGSTEINDINDNYGYDQFDFWILKLTSDGEIEWQKILGEDSDDYSYSIQQTSDGGYIIGGRITHKGWGVGIIKLSSDGNVEWQKYYGIETSAEAFSIQQTSDGGYVVAGNIRLFEAGRKWEVWILKLDSRGVVEWNKSYGGFEDENANFIYQTSDGGYIIAGNTYSFGVGADDVWILKLNLLGEVEWQKTYGGNENENVYSIQQTSDGGYILAGYSSSFGSNSPDLWIFKIDSEGDIEWNKTYGGSKKETANSIQQTFDGGYIIAGETKSFGAGSSDIWILKLNFWGDIEWEKTYGGNQDEEASFIQQTYDGGYIIAGSTDTYGAGKRDFLILKLFSNGDINPSCNFINDSNTEVFDINISPANTFIYPGIEVNESEDLEILPRESDVIEYSLCSEPHTLSLSTSSGGITIPQPGTYIFDHAERIEIKANPDLGYKFTGWSGDASVTDRTILITIDSDKSIQANFSLIVLDEIWERVKRTPCFIATAAYGSPIHPHVKALRDFRDRYLISSNLGRRFVSLYYKYSPRIADIITKHKSLRIVIRLWLLPAVALGYSMVHLGAAMTAIMLIFTLLAPFFFIWIYRRRRCQKD